MFDMQNIGRTIASARKAHDMTQMELADKLNISFQAISNWERGISMPDISKLPEIAELLGLSIDELLGKSSPLVEGLLLKEEDDSFPIPKADPEEVMEAAPILKPSQLQTVVGHNEAKYDISHLTSFLPFLPKDFVNDLAEKAYNEKGSSALPPFLPFLTKSKVDAIALHENELGHSITIFLPFMSSARRNHLAVEKYNTIGISGITTFLPFIDKTLVQQIAEKELADHGLSGLNTMIPFLDQTWLMDIIKNQMKL